MNSLTEYILWMSDIPITMTGIREADVLVLCNLVYFDLATLFVNGRKEAYLHDCGKLIDKLKVEIAIQDKRYTELMQAAAASLRFGDLRITDYVDIRQDDPPVQYAAVTFRDDKDMGFIAFRGTDATLAGWYEDFTVSYTVTKAQILAKEYTSRVIGEDPDRKWNLGGHSKGGNLALYSACTIEKELFDSVERIYDLDGPGLCPEVMKDEPIDRVFEKTTCIIPEFDVIGKLFELDFPETKIIRSFSKGMFQHAPITWGIDHGKLALAEKNHPLSIWVSDALDRWISCTDMDERKVFLTDIYEALSAGGARTLEDLFSQGWEGIRAVQQRLKNSSEVTRHIMQEFAKQALFSGFFPESVNSMTDGPDNDGGKSN